MPHRPYYNPLDVALTRTWGNISGTVTGLRDRHRLRRHPGLDRNHHTEPPRTGPTLDDGWFSADLPFGTYMVTFSSFGLRRRGARPHHDQRRIALLQPARRRHSSEPGGTSRAPSPEHDTATGIPATLVWTETTTLATTSHPTARRRLVLRPTEPSAPTLVTISSPGYADAVRGPDHRSPTASPYYLPLDVALVRPALPALPAAPVPTSGLEPDTKDTFDGCAALTPGAECELELPGGLVGSLRRGLRPLDSGRVRRLAPGRRRRQGRHHGPGVLPGGRARARRPGRGRRRDRLEGRDGQPPRAGGCAPTGTGSTTTGGKATGSATSVADTGAGADADAHADRRAGAGARGGRGVRRGERPGRRGRAPRPGPRPVDAFADRLGARRRRSGDPARAHRDAARLAGPTGLARGSVSARRVRRRRGRGGRRRRRRGRCRISI